MEEIPSSKPPTIVNPKESLSSRLAGDPLAIALFCLAGVMALVLYLVEKTPLSVSVSLAVIAGLMIYPVVHFFRTTPLRILVFIVVAVLTVGLGYGTWPKERSDIRGFMQLDKVLFVDTGHVISENKRLSIDMYLKNRGGEPVEDAYHLFESRLVKILKVKPDWYTGVDRETRAAMLADALKFHAQQLNDGHKGVTVGKGDEIWQTLYMPKDSSLPLTKEQADGIMSGAFRLYFYAWSRWRDAPRDVDFCEWLQPPEGNIIDNKKLIWHLCAQQ